MNAVRYVLALLLFFGAVFFSLRAWDVYTTTTPVKAEVLSIETTEGHSPHVITKSEHLNPSAVRITKLHKISVRVSHATGEILSTIHQRDGVVPEIGQIFRVRFRLVDGQPELYSKSPWSLAVPSLLLLGLIGLLFIPELVPSFKSR